MKVEDTRVLHEGVFIDQGDVVWLPNKMKWEPLPPNHSAIGTTVQKGDVVLRPYTAPTTQAEPVEVGIAPDDDRGKKYCRTIMDRYELGKSIRADIYCVLDAWGIVCPALQHAIKKVFAPGQRGHKSFKGDIEEAIGSLRSAIVLEAQRLLRNEKSRESDKVSADNSFKECETCTAKPGTPVLCESCLHNREVITRLQKGQ